MSDSVSLLITTFCAATGWSVAASAQGRERNFLSLITAIAMWVLVAIRLIMVF